jgi:hypothetical protein
LLTSLGRIPSAAIHRRGFHTFGHPSIPHPLGTLCEFGSNLRELVGAMGRAAEHQLKVGVLVVGLVGLCAWRLSHENGPRMAVALSAGIAQAQAHSALPAPAAGGGGGGGGGDGEREHSPATARLQGNGKWWAEWADGRARPFPIHKLDKPDGTLASVICITALPDRLTPVTGHPTALTELAIRDLWQQADVVVLAVPVASHTDASAAGRIGVPSWIGAYEEKVVVVRTRIDYGPSTRIIGCMFAVPEEYGDKVALIEADDDDAYPPNFVSGFMAYLSRDPTSAFSLSGFATDGNMLGEVSGPRLCLPYSFLLGREGVPLASASIETHAGGTDVDWLAPRRLQVHN